MGGCASCFGIMSREHAVQTTLSKLDTIKQRIEQQFTLLGRREADVMARIEEIKNNPSTRNMRMDATHPLAHLGIELQAVKGQRMTLSKQLHRISTTITTIRNAGAVINEEHVNKEINRLIESGINVDTLADTHFASEEATARILEVDAALVTTSDQQNTFDAAAMIQSLYGNDVQSVVVDTGREPLLSTDNRHSDSVQLPQSQVGVQLSLSLSLFYFCSCVCACYLS